MTNPTEAALRKLLTAMNFRAACLTGSDTAAFEHADAAMWRAHDEALAAVEEEVQDAPRWEPIAPPGAGGVVTLVDALIEACEPVEYVGADMDELSELCSKANEEQRSARTALLSAISRLAQGGQSWISVEEQLPTAETPYVLGWIPGWEFVQRVTYMQVRNWAYEEDPIPGACWQPLPTPPTTTERAGA